MHAEQSVPLVAPVVSWNFPAGHSVQAEAPVESENDPFGQETHWMPVPLSTVPVYFPVGQAAQASGSPVEASPVKPALQEHAPTRALLDVLRASESALDAHDLQPEDVGRP